MLATPRPNGRLALSGKLRSRAQRLEWDKDLGSRAHAWVLPSLRPSARASSASAFWTWRFRCSGVAILQMQPEMPVLDRRQDRNERVPTHVRTAADQTAGRVRLLTDKPRIIQERTANHRQGRRLGLSARHAAQECKPVGRNLKRRPDFLARDRGVLPCDGCDSYVALARKCRRNRKCRKGTWPFRTIRSFAVCAFF